MHTILCLEHCFHKPFRKYKNTSIFPDRNYQDTWIFPDRNYQDTSIFPDRNYQDTSIFPNRNYQDTLIFPNRNIIKIQKTKIPDIKGHFSKQVMSSKTDRRQNTFDMVKWKKQRVNKKNQTHLDDIEFPIFKFVCTKINLEKNEQVKKIKHSKTETSARIGDKVVSQEWLL